jgi:hypothetical protein
MNESRELRVFLEEICAELCRRRHVRQDGARPEDVLIRRDARIGGRNAFTDMLVRPPGGEPYAVEVKTGIPAEQLIARLHWKYAESDPDFAARRIVLVVDTAAHQDWPSIEQRLRSSIAADFTIDVWGEEHLAGLVREHLGVEIGTFRGADLLQLRDEIMRRTTD